MVWPERLLTNGKRPNIEWLGLGVSGLRIEKHRQVIEALRDVRMFRTKNLFADGQSSRVERLGLAAPPLRTIEFSQII